MASTPGYPPQTLLGFDFGRKRTGVAVGQMITRSASALVTLHSRDGRPDWAGIGKLIAQWQPDALVVGVPLHMDGSEQDMTRAARRFCRQLEGRFHVPVFEAEERLTSYAAERGAGQHPGEIDKLAAQLILQDWLEQQETSDL